MQKKTIYRLASLLLVISMLFSANLVVRATGNSAPANTALAPFTPVADAYVISTSATTNYGTATNLRVDSSPITNSYLRFTVSGVNGATVQSAVLRIYANTANPSGFAVKSVADNSWSESAINYSNAPAAGATLNSSTAVTAGAWVSVDVTSYVKADGTYSLQLSTANTTNTSLGAREFGANAPQLVVTTSAGTLPTATATTKPAATNTSVPGNTPTKTATPAPTSVGSGSVTVTPVADSYVMSSTTTTNYGTATNVRVDSSPITNSYLRFVVSGLSGAAQSASLRIYANSANTSGFSVLAVADNTWSESAITYSNAPAAGASINSSAALTAGTWVTVDVSSYVKGNGTFSFELNTTNTTNTSLASREFGANAPQLVVKTSGGVVPTSTPLPGNTPTKTATPLPTTANTPTKTATPGSPTPTASASCTAVVLTKGPTLIYTGDNTRMRVFWQWTANATFQVQWGTGTTYTSGNVAVNPTNTTTHLYTYDITGLTPGAKYNYRVVTGSQCSSGTFYAAPAASAASVKFVSYGDTRTNGSTHNGLAGQVVSLYKADPAFQTFNINVGDWVSGDSDSAWMSEWFAPSYTNIRTQDANLADIGIRGNHEGSATFWKQYWPEPFQSGGLYWSFDYGPIHVALLDAYTSYGAGSAQYNWLKADLAASTKTWKLVAIHEPGWSAGGGHANNTTVQNDLQPLLVQYGVSILFAGHNHYYARASVNGVTHLTMGGGGAPQYTPATGQPNVVVISKSYSFGEFTVSGNTLTAKVVNNSGATIDTFTITK